MEKIFGPFSGNKKNKKDHKTNGEQNRRTIPAISDHFWKRQLGQLATTLSMCDAQPDGGHQRKGPRIASWEVRLSSRAPTTGAREGGVRGIPECHCADSDGWETGGMSTLKTRKTASRTGTRGEPENREGARPRQDPMVVQKLLRHFRGCGILPRHGGCMGGRMSHAKSAKSAKSAGGNREKEIHKNVSNAPARPRMAGRREGCLH